MHCSTWRRIHKHDGGAVKVNFVAAEVLARWDAELARVQDGLIALKLERTALVETVEKLRYALEQAAQAVHQAHHTEQPFTWLECPRGFCVAIRRDLDLRFEREERTPMTPKTTGPGVQAKGPVKVSSSSTAVWCKCRPFDKGIDCVWCEACGGLVRADTPVPTPPAQTEPSSGNSNDSGAEP